MDCVHAELILFPALPNQWVEKATVVLRKYSDKKLDLADASIVVLADHLNLGDVLSVDVKDFTMLRWGNGKKTFHNLMSF
jgi:predicted nucleic acid-binding protein